MIQFSVLGSGSKGNAVYIESEETAILIDCGFSGKELQSRLDKIGRDPSKLSAILVTHEHQDHIGGVGVLSRRFGLEVHMNEGTWRGAEKRVGKLHAMNSFVTGEKYSYHDMEIKSFQISHDTRDPVGYVIGVNGTQLGYCTDTGKVTHLMGQRLKKCHGVILECNHDPILLKNGPYPLSLQQRVRSSQGHLANKDAAEFLEQIIHEELQHVVLAHLSEQNNQPEIAMAEVKKVIGEAESPHIHLASQCTPLELLRLTSS